MTKEKQEKTMDDAKLKLNPAAVLAVPADMADALIAAGDGDAALLCLYMLRRGGELNEAVAAQRLGMSSSRMHAAVHTLRRLGLLSGGEKAPTPAPELPEYEARDVVRRSAEDPQFQALLTDVQNALGRVLTSADIKSLFGIYDDLALPPEVILLLVNYCKEENAARYGGEKRLGFAFIEKVAYTWFDREIVTHEQADEWIGEYTRRKSLMGQLQRELGIQDRRLTPTERKYIDGWLELGFGVEALALAADRTITNTGGLRWKYMDSIVRSWHEKGLHTVEEIERGDRKPDRTGKYGSSAPSVPTQEDVKTLAQLERLRRKMKNGG